MITYDPVEIQQAYVDRQELEFPMLSDVGSAVIQRYGLLNKSVEAASRVYGIPHPGTCILDSNGRVLERFFERG